MLIQQTTKRSRRVPVEKRLARLTNKSESGCWIWLGGKQSSGHGKIRIDGKTHQVHRVAFELARGRVPAGLVLDHTCKNPSCINPKHLEPVTQRVNLLRGNTIPALHAAKTHCPCGHPYSGDNLCINNRGQRVCKACKREADKKSRSARREKC